MISLNEVLFVGMSKNCISTLKENIIFLEEFQKKTNLQMKIAVIDSDSDDGTKSYCKELLDSKRLDYFIEIDSLEQKYDSRIQRLAICRNEALKLVDKCIDDNLIYIPMDMDINLFKHMTTEQLEDTINFLINEKDIEGLFPFSIPFYYDIFALRKTGWVDENNLLIARKLKDKYKLFSFIFNYYFIFRKQLSPEKFDEKLIPVKSAFGGVGMYKIEKKNIKSLKYSYDEEAIDYVTEHLSFNLSFKNLFIYSDWNIEAPNEYIFWNSFSLFEKLIYISKSIKNDLKVFFKRKN